MWKNYFFRNSRFLARKQSLKHLLTCVLLKQLKRLIPNFSLPENESDRSIMFTFPCNLSEYVYHYLCQQNNNQVQHA